MSIPIEDLYNAIPPFVETLYYGASAPPYKDVVTHDGFSTETLIISGLIAASAADAYYNGQPTTGGKGKHGNKYKAYSMLPFFRKKKYFS